MKVLTLGNQSNAANYQVKYDTEVISSGFSYNPNIAEY